MCPRKPSFPCSPSKKIEQPIPPRKGGSPVRKRIRHTVTFTVLRPFVRLFMKLRYNHTAVRFRPPKDVKGPYLVLSNHVMDLDPFTVTLSFREPIFYVASDMIFSVKFWAFFMKLLVMPIPKTKYRSDLATIRDIRSIVKSGGSIGIFPEGNATFDGRLMAMPKAIGKLVKLLKIPVLLYNLEGGHLSNPRWGKGVRKGYMKGSVKRILRPEEYQTLAAEDIQTIIETELTVDDLEFAERHSTLYKGSRPAEYFESAYFYCPSCAALDTLHSEKDAVHCTSCGFTAAIDGWGRFHPADSEGRPILSHEWYDDQKRALGETLEGHPDKELFADEGERVLDVVRSTKKTFIGNGRLSLSPSRIVVDIPGGEHIEWPVEQLDAAVQQRNKLIIHNHDEDRTLYLLNHPRRNALKYVLAIEHIRGRKDT